MRRAQRFLQLPLILGGGLLEDSACCQYNFNPVQSSNIFLDTWRFWTHQEENLQSHHEPGGVLHKSGRSPHPSPSAWPQWSGDQAGCGSQAQPAPWWTMVGLSCPVQEPLASATEQWGMVKANWKMAFYNLTLKLNIWSIIKQLPNVFGTTVA